MPVIFDLLVICDACNHMYRQACMFQNGNVDMRHTSAANIILLSPHDNSHDIFDLEVKAIIHVQYKNYVCICTTKFIQ